MDWKPVKDKLQKDDVPFFIKNFCPNYREILTWEDVNNSLYRRDVGWEIIDSSGFKINIPSYESAWYGNVLDPGFILNSINSSKGFVITHMGRYNEKLNTICRDIEQEFYCASDIHVYGGLDRGQSFRTHHDPTSNFILQIEGITKWKVYNTRYCPISSINPIFPEEDGLDIKFDVELESGDLIYIPQNCYHKASPLGKRLSITIAMFTKTFNTPVINRTPLKINY